MARTRKAKTSTTEVDRKRALKSFTLSQDVVTQLEGMADERETFNMSAYVSRALELHFKLKNQAADALNKLTEEDYANVIGRVFTPWVASSVANLDQSEFLMYLLQSNKSELPKETWNRVKSLNSYELFALADKVSLLVEERKLANEEMLRAFQTGINPTPKPSSRPTRKKTQAESATA